jgi:hypothetical protein
LICTASSEHALIRPRYLHLVRSTCAVGWLPQQGAAAARYLSSHKRETATQATLSLALSPPSTSRPPPAINNCPHVVPRPAARLDSRWIHNGC